MNLLEQGYVQKILYPEFYECNPNFEEDLLEFLDTPRTRRARYTPRGYYNYDEERECFPPCPELLCGLIDLHYQINIKGSRFLREGVPLANKLMKEIPGIDYSLANAASLSNVLTRLDTELNIGKHENSYDRLTKIKRERHARNIREGKKRHKNLTVANRKKLDQQKSLTQSTKELRSLKEKEKRLKANIASKARRLRLHKDPQKFIGTSFDPSFMLFFLLCSFFYVRKTDARRGPDIIIKDNLIETYNIALATGVDEKKCMEIYKEIILGDHKYDERQVAFLPTPRQYKFLSAPEDIVLYGGAAGGGKSFSLVLDPLRFVHHRDHNAVIIRKSMPELRQLINISQELYAYLTPKPKYRENDHTWYFPSGAKIWFSFLETANDKWRYQGQDYTYIGFDELSQHATDEGFTYLLSRLRRPLRAKEIIPYVRATANPGSQWVYDRFIAPAPPETTFIYPSSIASSKKRTAKFIPARLEDNPHLDLDGDYRSMLELLPDVERRQLLEGDWLASQDSMFPEFDPKIHVTEEFYIPKHWTRVAGLDYGYRDPAAAVYFAVNPENGCIIVYDEIVERNLTGKEFALMVRTRDAEELVHVDHPIDWSVFARTGHTGPTIAESMMSVPGLRMRPADRNREAGWNQLHEYLRVDPKTGAPKFQIFSKCVKTIRQLSNAKIHPNKSYDLDDKRTADGHWDALDALRYGIMSRPRLETLDERLVRYKQESRWNKINDYFSL